MTHHRVHVHWTDLDAGAAELGRFADMLAPDERERGHRFRAEQDRRRYIVRHGRLRELLADHLGTPAAEIRIHVGRFGKPFVPGSDVRFSLSHSRGIALYAIARGIEVGCDIEFREPRLACPQVANRFFSMHEARMLRALPLDRYPEGFFNCWTRKEAYVKARGLGLSLPLDAFDVSLSPADRPALLRGCEGWSVQAFEPLPFYHAAVVAQGEDWQIETLVGATPLTAQIGSRAPGVCDGRQGAEEYLA